MSKIQKMFRYLSHDLDIFKPQSYHILIYMYIYRDIYVYIYCLYILLILDAYFPLGVWPIFLRGVAFFSINE